MNTCKCGNALHRDFPDTTERCSGCERTSAWCRCARTTAQRRPLWLERAQARRNGLARDESGSLVA